MNGKCSRSCDIWLSLIDARYCTDPISSRARAMMDKYELFDIGKNNEHFTNTVVYVRRQ